MITNDWRRRPRRKRPPSARDQALFVAYQVQGRSQKELAKEHGVTQCRVSQILRRVAAWRDQGCSEEHRQQRDAAEAVYRGAMRQLLHQERNPTVTTVRTGPHGIETTVRQVPPSAKWLIVAQRAGEQLSRLAKEGPEPRQLDPDERQRIMIQELVKLREAADRAGRVRTRSQPFAYVVSLLRALQGHQPLPWEVDPGLVELGVRLLWKQQLEAASEESSARPDQQPALAAEGPRVIH